MNTTESIFLETENPDSTVPGSALFTIHLVQPQLSVNLRSLGAEQTTRSAQLSFSASQQPKLAPIVACNFNTDPTNVNSTHSPSLLMSAQDPRRVRPIHATFRFSASLPTLFAEHTFKRSTFSSDQLLKMSTNSNNVTSIMNCTIV